MMFYFRNCVNCRKEFFIDGIEDVLFCCEECKKTHYEDSILRAAKKLDIDVPIEERWDILDL